MEITKPGYYDLFRCTAGDCPDSCCRDWEVQVDETAAAYYRRLPGALGDRLRQVLRDTDDGTVMAIEDGRCPMWQADGLCRIQAELGEEALCRVCREFPRLRHDYGDFVELGLELSCPEAARHILGAPPAPRCTVQVPGEGEGEYDPEAMACLKRTREAALALLEQFPPDMALSLLLLFGVNAQEELELGEELPFVLDPETPASLALEADLREFLHFFENLEILTDAWRARLAQPHTLSLPPQTAALARYLVERYWLQAVSDLDLVSRVKFIVISCLLVGALGGDYCETAQLFSKEIENDADNVDAILDAAYTCPAFTDGKLLGMLTGRCAEVFS